ncbi:hypothetical protein ACFE04_029433 [Oxalis oulophora]
MANGVERENGELFSEEEMNGISGVIKGRDFIELMCGCTSHRYGDAVGKLRVFSNGDLEITCECTPACDEGTITPAAFEKHSGRETSRKWKSNVWVIVNGDKVPLSKTVLLKYYNKSSKTLNGCQRTQTGRVCHRDEFLRCSKCNKERRFRLRTKEECRVHHDAVADGNWNCADLSYDKVLLVSIGNNVSEYHVTMMKKGQVERFIGAVLVLQLARAVLPVYALAVKSADFPIAAAKLAPTSLGTTLSLQSSNQNHDLT